MKSIPPNRIAFALLILSPCLIAQTSATHITTPSKAVANAGWTRGYANPYVHPSQMDVTGRENQLNQYPRFAELLAHSFPQKQWFWYDHYHFTPVAKLIQIFIWVPGDVFLDDQRYVTADGCVPHDCTNRGMLWIDTKTNPAALIFAGTNRVKDSSGRELDRLWLFSSTKLNWSSLPQPFLSSLNRWETRTGSKGYMGTGGYRYNFVLATIVQPNGEMVDISPATLHPKIKESGANQ